MAGFELASSRRNEPGRNTGERSRRVSGHYNPAVNGFLQKSVGQWTADRAKNWPYGRKPLTRLDLGPCKAYTARPFRVYARNTLLYDVSITVRYS